MKKMINNASISGRVYDCKLERKQSGERSKNPGTPFISGTIDVATDEKCENIVQIHYTYATETTKTGKVNNTYVALENLIDNGKTVLNDGKEAATRIRWEGAIDLNEFTVEREGREELVSAKRNEGGFLHILTNTEALDEDENKRTNWETDMLITNVIETEADEERNLPVKGTIKGYIFNFRNEILPVDFVTHNPKAIDYFMGLEASPRTPIFTKVWGREVSQVIVTRIVEESAFGEDSVTERTSSRKEFLITGTSKNTYEWDSEDTLTAQEVREALANREIMLAERKRQREEWEATRDNAKGVTKITAVGGNYDF